MHFVKTEIYSINLWRKLTKFYLMTMISSEHKNKIQFFKIIFHDHGYGKWFAEISDKPVEQVKRGGGRGASVFSLYFKIHNKVISRLFSIRLILTTLWLYINIYNFSLWLKLVWYNVHVKGKYQQVREDTLVWPLRFYPPYTKGLVVLFLKLIAWNGFWQFFLFLPNFWAKTAGLKKKVVFA